MQLYDFFAHYQNFEVVSPDLPLLCVAGHETILTTGDSSDSREMKWGGGRGGEGGGGGGRTMNNA